MNPFQNFVRFLRRAPTFPKTRLNTRRPALEILEDRTLPSTLSGFVFHDTNNNGRMDPGEAGLQGVIVQLQGVDSAHHLVVQTQTTNSAGLYQFTNLKAGTYQITEIQPAHYVPGQEALGSLGGAIGQGDFSNIVLPLNGTGSGYNFGELAQVDGWSAVTTHFSAASIPAGSTLWFNSVLTEVHGLGANPVTVQLVNQKITFTVNGSLVTVAVPNSTITFSPTATTATTTFNAGTNTWTTVLPSNFKGDGFLAAVAFPVTSRLPGNISDVTWEGQFSSSVPGVSLQWKWGAAAYSKFSTNYNALNVNPLDAKAPHHRRDRAGTPEAFTAFVRDGGTQDHANTFTGHYSPLSERVQLPVTPASLSGFVRLENTGQGLPSTLVTLTGTNNLGQTVNMSVITGSDGSYSFHNLLPGTYTITESPNSPITDEQNSVGTAGGHTSAGSDQITGIMLNAGISGMNYNFGDQPPVGGGS